MSRELVETGIATPHVLFPCSWTHMKTLPHDLKQPWWGGMWPQICDIER